MVERILIVDDEQTILDTLAEFFTDSGYKVACAPDGRSGLDELRRFEPALVLLDLRLPDMDGLEVLTEIKDTDPLAGVVMITGHGDVDSAVRAMQSGADHFVLKPIDLSVLVSIAERVIKSYHRNDEIDYLHRRIQLLRGAKNKDNILLPKDLVEKIHVLAESAVTSVLILGETGTGKGVVAELIHELGVKRTGQFIDLNCASLTGSLLESELFGHEAGAFTDAKKRKRGLLELADGGSLFLDEIGEMNLDAQAKLLKVIESHAFRRVGGTQTIHVDTRIIAATNMDLDAAVQKRQFRRDLYYRLNVLPLALPPLRDRRETIPALARQFIREYCRSLGRKELHLNTQAESSLSAYNWPGNIRELKNIIERAVLLCQGHTITPRDLPENLQLKRRTNLLDLDIETKLEDIEKAHIRRVLDATGQNRSHAAELLGLHRATLIKKSRSMGWTER